MNENEYKNPADQAVLPEDETTCACCGAIVKIADCTVDANGDLICPECLDREYAKCDDCGEWFPRDELTVTRYGDRVCETCLDDGYFCCEDCGEWFPRIDEVEVNPGTGHERYVCEDCADRHYHKCEGCGEYFDDDYIILEDAFHAICTNCEENWCSCANCGEVLRRDDAVWDEENYEYYCSDCAPERGSLHDYGFKPDPIFGTTGEDDGRSYYRGSELTFGVELECDDGGDVEDAVSDVTSLTDRVYCKHDGSLSEGYEIVTHPGTLAWHKERFPWAGVCSASRDNGFHSHDTDTCGLHVHVGRDQLGDNPKNTAAKMALIMVQLKPWFVRFSRRKGESRWASYLAPDTLPADDEEALDDVYQKLRASGRYLAVNVQPRATVEVRIFRGSLVPETVLAAVELVSNLALYARDHSLDECLAITWDKLVTYERHPELDDYCARRMMSQEFAPITFSRETPPPPSEAPSDVFPYEGSEVAIESSPEAQLQRGDIVYCNSDNPDDRRIRGRFGLVLDAATDWITVAWFLPNDANRWETAFDAMHHRPYGTGWGLKRSGLRKVLRIGDHQLDSADAEQTLTVYRDYGLLPGDRVMVVDANKSDALRVADTTGRYLLSCMANHTGPLCECHWPELVAAEYGHDSCHLRPGSFGGWHVVADNLCRVDD